MRAHAGQGRVRGQQRRLKLVVVVVNIGENTAIKQQVVSKPVAGAGHQPQLEHIEIFRAAQRL